MTRKVYKSAMGRTVDMGALLLRNENVRAVGNMNVNARGDRIDSNNRVIESRNQQVQRRYDRQSNVSAGPAHTGTGAAQRQADTDSMVDPLDTFADLPQDDPTDTAATPEPVVAPAAKDTSAPDQLPAEDPAPSAEDPAPLNAVPPGGLAAAIARSKEVKQELMKTPRQQLQSQGVRKI